MADATQHSRTFSRAQLGLETPEVTVETHLPGGLPGFTLVGLPETAVREARDRVKSAIANCGLDFPLGRVVVNLAPADLAKQGARYDLAIAVSILAATGQIPHLDLGGFEFLGELSLGGALRATRGCLCAGQAAAAAGRRLVVPAANGAEMALAPNLRAMPLAHLQEVLRLLRAPDTYRAEPAPVRPAADPVTADLNDVMGQQAAKRALCVAAAGGHHMLMVGPPGTGKTMLARRLLGLLPPLAASAALEVAAVHSAAGLDPPPAGRAPFRDPHHSASAPALVGGGSHPLPGEVTLAHRGVLFLDELPHFKPSVLDMLREPLESREITINRARGRCRFPASFQLLAAMNPCPAGRVCSEHGCRCRPDQVQRYQARISGPLLDRIDLHVAVPPVPKALLLEGDAHPELPAAEAAQRVATARAAQLTRQGKLNTELTPPELGDHAGLDAAGRRLMSNASDRYRLSARGHHRVLKVARSVADLQACDAIAPAHIAEALSYRAMDWEGHRGAT